MRSLFVKERSDSNGKYADYDIIKMLEFLVVNIIVFFAENIPQQIIGIPLGTHSALLLPDIFLYSYEGEFICSLLYTFQSFRENKIKNSNLILIPIPTGAIHIKVHMY